jgi:hypothetical protein
MILLMLGLVVGQVCAQDSSSLKSPALMYRDSTLVPLRELAEWMGAVVEWRPPTIVITKGERQVVLTLGSKTAKAGNDTIRLTLPPKVIRDVVYVPLRFVGEALGATVEYDDGAGEVTVQAGGKSTTLPVHLAYPPSWWPRRVPPSLENYRHVTEAGCTVMRAGRCAYRGQCQGRSASAP